MSDYSKEELIPLHALLYETAKYVAEEEDLDVTQGYNEYFNMNVRPSYAHRNKPEHKEAIKTLSALIEKNLSGDRSDTKLLESQH